MRKTRNLDATRHKLVSAWRLCAPFPLTAVAEPVARRGNGGCVTVVYGGERQRESPRPGESVETDGYAERYCHQADGGAGEKPGGIFAGKKRKPGQEKRDEQTGEGHGKKQNGIMELGKRGAGDHVANFRERAVAAEADAGAREPHPDSSAIFLHGAGERTIVNHFPANRSNSADGREHVAPQQNTSARGSSCACVRICDPARRIEHQKKIEKWGNQ